VLFIIACPCALILSTLAAIASGLAAGARRGLLVKGGGALEVIGRVRITAFDKTGTLTQGKPRVTDVLALSGTERSVLGLAAPRKHRPNDEGVTPTSLSGAYLGRQRLDFLLTIMKAWQFSLGISANIGICGVGGRFEVPEEVAIVSDLEVLVMDTLRSPSSDCISLQGCHNDPLLRI
jgi:magnesium-transporting ATPase (P-type)